ncbi:3-deoxy-manno-octulosonate cytidylyltransferase (CMP-KDO synthetase) [Novosphingobium hassiacum]|uniref:3-deoxy-manno-octulosonate cytidylyltransferase (CMP-KDO synthetase) n=1 Tax=Novosphingobium hassiacum TaxID=173676 RepID=A0A7W6EUY8_9SPHN|nr:3-deoxy-manno-octulosonate cytidylyltransferase [Novosphingobium hassiacum]MBB3859400.1 3-deoxy-manno-octulosonate cytidylyltransferase (CMP-KDO synthetase) [Novosphingobium hassiacum]
MVSVPDLIVVPARFGSSRLPGKPLLPIAGRTLLDRVVAIARAAAVQAGNCDVLVATDDARIADHAASLGVEVAMTAAELDSGTVRAFAAARQRESAPARVINLQGDAPFIPAAIVAGLMATLRKGGADVATPVFQLDWARLDRLRAHKQTAPFSGTTCVRASDRRALWFSKSILPAMRNEAQLREQPMSPVWQHLGLYGYTMRALEWFAGAAPGVYEALEGLEQLRFIENGWRVDTVEVDVPAHLLSGIDTPEDLAKADEAITRFGDPYPV